MFLVEIEKRVKRVPRYLHYNNSPAPGPLFRRFDQDSPGCPAIYSVINNKLRGGLLHPQLISPRIPQDACCSSVNSKTDGSHEIASWVHQQIVGVL